jgi:hypothetical protein
MNASAIEPQNLKLNMTMMKPSAYQVAQQQLHMASQSSMHKSIDSQRQYNNNPH